MTNLQVVRNFALWELRAGIPYISRE